VSGAERLKLVWFVPREALDATRSAVFEAGAGRIGEYQRCSWYTAGTGTFFGGEGTAPSIGRAGREERVSELRVETVVPADRAREVVAALIAAHPYEEMAYDVYALANPDPRAGMGRVGTLPEPMAFTEFCSHVSECLRTDRLSVAGRAECVRTVAVMGGSGGKYLSAARGADAYVTGEVGHHDALEAQAMRMAIVDAGHFSTERVVVEPLKRYLEAALPGLDVTVADETDPLRRA